MITESYSFTRSAKGKSPCLRVLSPTELRDCIKWAGSYDTFFAALTAEKHPVGTYVQVVGDASEGVTIRGYRPLLSPEADAWRRRARKRLNLPL